MTEPTYSISDLAKEFGVTTRAIRFYEEKGLISPLREGQKRIYTVADRVRIKLILRGKRIGMTLEESGEVINMYDPANSNAQQLRSLLGKVEERRTILAQQKKDIEEMLDGLAEVEDSCKNALATKS